MGRELWTKILVFRQNSFKCFITHLRVCFNPYIHFYFCAAFDIMITFSFSVTFPWFPKCLILLSLLLPLNSLIVPCIASLVLKTWTLSKVLSLHFLLYHYWCILYNIWKNIGLMWVFLKYISGLISLIIDNKCTYGQGVEYISVSLKIWSFHW